MDKINILKQIIDLGFSQECFTFWKRDSIRIILKSNEKFDIFIEEIYDKTVIGVQELKLYIENYEISKAESGLSST